MRILGLATILTFAFNSLGYAETDPSAKINLAFVGQNDTAVSVGESFIVRLEATAATVEQRFIVTDVIFGWDTSVLEFVGVSHENSHPLIMSNISGLPYCPPGQTTGCGDFYGLNEVIPPVDGNGLYYGYNQLGSVLIVGSEPITISDFEFKVIAPFTSTEITIIPEMTVNYPKRTVLYGSYIPGNNVLGQTTNATIEGAALAGDFDGDGMVGPTDLSMLMANWGSVGFKQNPYDLDGDGTVSGSDLAILFSNWT